ncbi:MAG: phosphate ABC transporter permease subunit PstC, partial [Rhodospirillales bacterium]|nr:phosphate ABC transporter permease subunit PstC [Rhodospirillales bacterium]
MPSGRTGTGKSNRLPTLTSNTTPPTGGFGGGRMYVTPKPRRRVAVERMILSLLIISSTVAVITTIGIVLSLIFETVQFFRLVPITDFLFGIHWSPQTAIRADQVGATGAFGAIPLLAGTFLISAVALSVSGPIGLLSAIFISEYAAPKTRTIIKPSLEILAGVPTVVYGFFAVLVVAPLIRDGGEALGIAVSSESALAAGLVMGVMTIPFVSSISDDAITAVPLSLREAALGLGSTRSEVIRKVTLPAALPGIAGGMLLAASRVIGETMIVVMAAGL